MPMYYFANFRRKLLPHFNLCSLTLAFYKMQFQVCIITFMCYQLIFIIEFAPKMKHLFWFNFWFNRIFLFLDLRSVLQMIFFVTFYFLLFLFDQTILVLDGCYFQTSKTITKSIGIIWQKVDANATFCAFSENSLYTFLSFICITTSAFFCYCFQVTN